MITPLGMERFSELVFSEIAKIQVSFEDDTVLKLTAKKMETSKDRVKAYAIVDHTVVGKIKSIQAMSENDLVLMDKPQVIDKGAELGLYVIFEILMREV